jgi:hypothetical protein
VEGSCEHGNEPSGSIKCWEFLEWLHNWQLLKKGSAPWVSEWVRTPWTRQISIRCSGRHSKWVPLECKSRTLPLQQHVTQKSMRSQHETEFVRIGWMELTHSCAVAGDTEPLDSLQQYQLHHIYWLHHLTQSVLERNSSQIMYNALSFAWLYGLTSRESQSGHTLPTCTGMPSGSWVRGKLERSNAAVVVAALDEGERFITKAFDIKCRLTLILTFSFFPITRTRHRYARMEISNSLNPKSYVYRRQKRGPPR